MPALITHHIFGLELLKQITTPSFEANTTRQTEENLFLPALPDTLNAQHQQLFLLGNQGPDPFYFISFSCKRSVIRSLGNLFQDHKIDTSIQAFRDYITSLPQSERSVLTAYFLGYLCHFVLDRMMHPLVDAQSSYGNPKSHTHGQIESDLDIMMLHRFLSQSCARGTNIKLVKQALLCEKQQLELISQMFASVAKAVYGVDIIENGFGRSVKDMRFITGIFNGKKGKRKLLWRIENFALNGKFRVLFLPKKIIDCSCSFDNAAHSPWVNPQNLEVCNFSFDDIFARAQSEALQTLNLYLKAASAREISKGLNFSGGLCAD